MQKNWTQRLSAYAKNNAEPDLHQEWRLVLFVCTVGAVCAVIFLFPWLAAAIALTAAVLGLISLRRYGAWAFPSILFGGIVLATMLSLVRLSGFEAYDFTPDQFVRIEGQIDKLEFRPEKPVRLVISVTRMQGFRGKMAPKRLRLAVRTEIDSSARVGSSVRLSAIIAPNGGALVPSGYDFGRSARFQHIGGRGYATSAVVVTEPGSSVGLDITTWLNRLRYSLATQIEAGIPGQPGALAVALTLGLRHGISDDMSEILRRAGLSHLLAISGLHMGIVAAVAFFTFELLFAAIPAIALRIMPRRLAVAPAWTLALCYLLLSGGSTATIRAFIMVSVAMLAILTERRVLSLRSVALAALAILIIWPESVLTVGFQMSFAATTGLIAFYERVSSTAFFAGAGKAKPLWWRAGRAVLLIGVTSFVAQVSIAPFALYHFQALSVIGVVANIIVLPIISFAVMPLLLLALLLTIFSGLALVSWLLHPLLAFVIEIASLAATPEFSTARTLPMSELVLGLLLAGFISAVLFVARRGLYLSGAFIALALIVPGRAAVEVLVSRTGSVIAVQTNNGIAVSGGRADSFRIRSWRRYWGMDPFQKSDKLTKTGDGGAWRYQLKTGTFLTRINGLSAVHGSCAAGGIVVLPRKYARYCKGAGLIITKEDLLEFGPAGLSWPKANKPIVSWANPPEGK